MSLLAEVKRRNVHRVGAAYLATSWLLMQVADVVLPRFGLDDRLITTFIILLVIGFPLALIFAWVYELTPEGLKKEREVDGGQSITRQTGKKLDQVIIIVLTLALGFFAIDKFLLDPVRDQEQAELVAQTAVERALSDLQNQGPPDKSIAVLPFVDLSPNHDQEYFSDGLAEELLGLLAGLPELLVISRTSAFSFKDKGLPIADIARELNVAHVLEGSVRMAGDQVRITAQLIDTRTDAHLWSGNFDRTMNDIFAVQEDIATEVIAALKVELLDGPVLLHQTDPEAYRLYTLSHHVFYTSLDADQDKSARLLLEKSLEIDPEYAPAWALLSRFYIRGRDRRELEISERVKLARDAADKALELDPDNGVAYVTRANLAELLDKDWGAAAANLERAATLDPTNLETLSSVGTMAAFLGRLDDAIELFEYAVARDPFAPKVHEALMQLYCFAGLNERCVTAARAALVLNDKAPQARCYIAWFQSLAGDPDGALATVEDEPILPCRQAVIVVAHHILGDAANSDAALQVMFEMGPTTSTVYALVYRGEIDRAMNWIIENAGRLGPRGLSHLSNESILSELHPLPAFQELLEQAGVSPAQLAEIEFSIELPKVMGSKVMGSYLGSE